MLRTMLGRVRVRMSRAAASRAGEPSSGEAGMTTAEYAVGTVAACGFGGVLYKVVTSHQVLSLLTSVISRALHLTF